MAHRDVRFGPGGVRPVGAQKVYTRTTWSAGGGWTSGWVLQSNLICTDATWSVAPSLPTATLSWLYGRIQQPGQSQMIDYAKKTGLSRLWVKVSFECELDTSTGVWGTRNWYGLIEITQDVPWGAYERSPGDGLASGEQTIICYGLEKLLVDHRIISSVWDSDGAPEVSRRPVAFNTFAGRSRPNMTAGPVGNTHIFEPDVEEAEYWTSLKVCQYLLDNQTPRNQNDSINVPFELGPTAASIIPDWDRPELEQEDANTYSLLSRLIDRRRLLSWHLEVGETDGTIGVIPTTLTDAAISLDVDGAPEIPANSNTRHLIYDTDQLTSGTDRESTVHVYDQVIQPGATRRSVGSFSYADENIENGWTDSQETSYKDGAPSYPANAGTATKQKADAQYRARTALENVYSYFKIPVDWDGTVADGEGSGVTFRPLFPENIPADSDNHPVFYGTLSLAPTMPLEIGVDYVGYDVDDADLTTGNNEESRPLVFFKIPGSSRWIRADRIGVNAFAELADKEDDEFQVRVIVPDNLPGIRLKVSGATNAGGGLQHAIAKTDFTKKTSDVIPGEYDYRDAIFTLCLYDDRRGEGRWPADADLPSQDVIRRKELPPDDSYEINYVAPATVLDVGDDSSLGRTAAGGFLMKPPEADRHLTALAKVAAGWYTNAHRVLSLLSARLKDANDLQLGDLVTKIGDPDFAGSHLKTINSPISQISFSYERGPEGDQPEPVMRVETWAGELDAAALEPPPPDEDLALRRLLRLSRAIPKDVLARARSRGLI